MLSGTFTMLTETPQARKACKAVGGHNSSAFYINRESETWRERKLQISKHRKTIVHLNSLLIHLPSTLCSSVKFQSESSKLSENKSYNCVFGFLICISTMHSLLCFNFTFFYFFFYFFIDLLSLREDSSLNFSSIIHSL